MPSWRRGGNLVAKTARRDDCKKPTADGGGSDDDRWHPEVHALAEGRESTLTVSEGAAAVDWALGRSRRGKPGGDVSFCVRQVLVELSQKLAGPDTCLASWARVLRSRFRRRTGTKPHSATRLDYVCRETVSRPPLLWSSRRLSLDKRVAVIHWELGRQLRLTRARLVALLSLVRLRRAHAQNFLIPGGLWRR